MSNNQHILNKSIFDFRKLTLYSRDTVLIQKKILQFLKVNDLGELRDKYEGVAYFNKLSLKLYSIIALERYLGIKILDIENLPTGDVDFNITDEDMYISVIPFYSPDLPLIKRDDKSPSIITFFKDTRSLFLCGYLSGKEKVNKKNLRSLNSPVWKDRNEFIGFEKLKMFDNLIQLKELYKYDS